MGRGGTPYNDLYGEAPPERGTFFVKNGIQKGKGLDLGAAPPRIKICWVPPGAWGSALFTLQEF